jgi:hypothetical protein
MATRLPRTMSATADSSSRHALYVARGHAAGQRRHGPDLDRVAECTRHTLARHEDEDAARHHPSSASSPFAIGLFPWKS